MKKIFTTVAFCLLALASQGQAFFTQTTYRGAFGQGAGANWTAGWANWDPKNTLYPGDPGGPTATLVNVPDSTIITTAVTWSSSNYYVLQGQVFVKAGGVLTIQPGTVIRGTAAGPGQNPSFLCVSQGGKINAVGTASNPIVFTSAQQPSSRATGDWGGVMICGKAPVNLNNPATGIGGRNFEATPGYNETFYGGTDATDNSGTMRYCRIEFAGDARLANQELNGLMLAAVGNGTTVDHIMTSYSNDDSYEWFGGSVNCKYLIAFAGTDDDFDMDEGYNGKLQFLLGVRHPAFFDVSGSDASNGFELDNNTNSGGNGTSSQTQYSPSPVTSPTISNVTMIGPLKDGQASSAVNNSFGFGPNYRTGPAAAIFNSVFFGYQSLFRSQQPTLTGVAAGPSNNTKFCSDSATVKNSWLGQDVANSTALITTGGYQSTNPTCPGTNPNNAANYLTLLTDGAHNNTFTNASTLTPAFLGIASPYYSGAIGSTAFGDAGTVSYTAFDPTLTVGSQFLSGAAFTDARLTNFLSAGDLTISTTQTPATGAYNNVTVTGTGVANLSQNLNISGTLTVQSGGVLNLGQYAIEGPGSVNIAAGAIIRVGAAGGVSSAATGIIKNSGSRTISADANWVFNGSSAQVTGALLTATRDLEIANAAGVTVNAPVVVGGVLDLTSGTLTSGGNLTIGSTGSRQGMIDDFSAGNSGTISGTIKFRRLTTGVAYKHLSAPLAGATFDNITDQGVACSSIREFEEATNSWILVEDPCNGNPMPQMTSNAVLAPGSKTFTYTGTLSTGVKTASIIRPATTPGVARGWNALGNPYPSPIRWSLVGAQGTNTAVSNMVAYIFNSSTNNYGTVSASGAVTGGANDVIAPGQGFLVRKSAVGGASTFTLNNNVRLVQTAPPTFIREGREDELARISFRTEGGADEIVLNTRGEKAEKLFSDVAGAPALFVNGYDEPMTVAPVAAVSADTRIELGLVGNGQLSIENLNVPAGLTAYVVNSRTGRIQALATGATMAASEQDRLALIFRQGASEAASSVYAYRAADGIRVVLAGNEGGSLVELVDATGKVVTRTAVQAGQVEASVAAPVAAGVYQLRVSGSCNGITRVATAQ